MAAVNQIIANGDNSLATPNGIVIVSPCTFVETVDLGNAAIVSLNIEGCDGAVIAPASGNALQSLVNNNGFLKAYIRKLQFNALVVLQNPTDGGIMGQQIIDFRECEFSGGLSASNIVSIGFTHCDFGQGTTKNLVNILQGYCYSDNSGHNGSTFTLTTDNSQPKPSGFTGSYFLAQGSSYGFSTINIGGPDPGSQLDLDIGAIAGRVGGTLSIGTGALVRLFHGATISSDITVMSGAELRMLGGSLRGALTIQSGGIYTQQGLSASANLRAATYEIGSAASGNSTITGGTGSPEGIVTANPGSLFLRTDGGTLMTLYVKETGVATNTGWIAK
jgi:hypothetical protein